MTDHADGEPLLSCKKELLHPSQTWKCRLSAARNKQVLSCKWSPDDELLAASYVDGGIRLWNSDTGRLVCTHLLDDSEDQENVDRGIKYYSKKDSLDTCTTCMQWHPSAKRGDRLLLAVDTAGQAAIYQVTGRSEMAMNKCWSISEPRELKACDWVRGGEAHVAVGGFSQSISLYDLETSELVETLAHKISVTGKITGHTKRIHMVRCASHDPHVILSAAWDHAALIWDTRTASVVRWFTAGDLVMNGGLPADISSSGDMIVTCSDIQDGSVAIWDIGGKGIIDQVPCPQSRPTCVQFSKDIESADIAVGACGKVTCGWMQRASIATGGDAGGDAGSDAEEAPEEEAPEWSLQLTGWAEQLSDMWTVDWAHRTRRVCAGATDGSIAIVER